MAGEGFDLGSGEQSPLELAELFDVKKLFQLEPSPGEHVPSRLALQPTKDTSEQMVTEVWGGGETEHP